MFNNILIIDQLQDSINDLYTRQPRGVRRRKLMNVETIVHASSDGIQEYVYGIITPTPVM